MSPIIDIQQRLVEVGRIRLGAKTERGAPTKLETFRLTSRDRVRLDAAAALYGGEVRDWRDGEHELITTATELPIVVMPGQALTQWHELWSGGGCQRRCDGQRMVVNEGKPSDRPCLCDETGKRTCKPTTRLSVMLPDVPGLGVWRLESHGWNAAVELAGTSRLLEAATVAGQLLPARLRLEQRTSKTDGKTHRYAVPVIDIDVRVDTMLSITGGPSPVAELGPAPAAHTPIARELEAGGVSVADALEATDRQAAPAAKTGRSAPDVGPVIEGGSSAPPLEAPDDGGGVESEDGPGRPTPGSDSPSAPTTEPKMANDRQRRMLFAVARERGVDEQHLKSLIREITGQESTKAIPADQFELVLTLVQAQAEPVEGATT